MAQDERQRVAEKLADLATEYCIAVDKQAEDIGGSRSSMTILQEIGPLTDIWEKIKEKGSVKPKTSGRSA